MDTTAMAETGIHIHDRAARLVEGMRKADEARDASQKRAAEFISEQMERIAQVEAEAAGLRQDRDGLQERLELVTEEAAAARRGHAAEVAALNAENEARVQGVVSSASKEIERLKEWVKQFQGEMGEKQAALERDNARLALESERLSEENAALLQTAEALIGAIEEQSAALQRQDALVEEAMRREPPRPRAEGSVIRMPARPRPESAEAAPVETAAVA